MDKTENQNKNQIMQESHNMTSQPESKGDETGKEETEMEDKQCCNINRNYVPIKAHYFFMFGGMGGTMPYMQVLAKDFGISPTAVGIIYTIVPLCVCLSKPLFGFITDKIRNFRAILIMLLAVTAISYFSVLYVPSIKNRKVQSIELTAACKEPRNELIMYPPKYDTLCAKEIVDWQFDCKLTSSNCLKNGTLGGTLNVTRISPDEKSISLEFTFKMHKKYVQQLECDCLKHNLSSLICEPDFYKCDTFSSKAPSEYEMHDFWTFVILSIISGAGSATLICLTDAACYEILSGSPTQYGKQRLWGTVSWGITTLTSGYLNDVATGNSKDTNYSPGFYLMLAFLAVDMLILCRFRLEKANMSTNICRDVGTIFSSWKTIVFSVGVYISGAMAGLLWTYQFWFLTELGSNQLLLGLVAGVQCLVAEVPFFFFSGWFVKKFGHFYCLIATFAAFALRMGLYSILQNPWLILPIEPLHGVTFGIFYAAMTLYAVDSAPPGTEATMLGILGGIFEGLGVATGSFLGGIGFDNIGGRWTFFAASMVSLCCVPLFTIIYKMLPKSDGKVELNLNLTTYKNEALNYGSQDSIRQK